MKNIHYIFSLAILVLFACNGNRESGLLRKKLAVQPELFQLQTLFTDAEQHVSFPNWFNDSLIAQAKIRKITRLYFLPIEDAEATDEPALSRPREKREYWFYPNGNMRALHITNYYDEQEIGKVAFHYANKRDTYGYSTSTKTSQIDPMDDNLYFKSHTKIKYTNKYLAYQNDQSGDYLFYMLHKKYWGPLSIDSILKPTPKDNVILGFPMHPIKKYKVANKVNESEIKLYTYALNRKTSVKTIQKIDKQDYPFQTKRSFTFTKAGIAKGYTDSTFSNSTFLTRTITEFIRNKKQFPEKVMHKKDNPWSKAKLSAIEHFQYEYGPNE
jgi:hypothetical protein